MALKQKDSVARSLLHISGDAAVATKLAFLNMFCQMTEATEAA